MNDKRSELDEKLRQAQTSENAGDFLNAAFWYKSVLKLARDLGDLAAMGLSKGKVLEMSQRSMSSFNQFRFEQEIPEEEVERVVNAICNNDLGVALKSIGIHPALCPQHDEVCRIAQETMPLLLRLANSATFSQDGHLVRGGADGEKSWCMKMYEVEQRWIEIYLRNVFQRLTERGLTAEKFTGYLTATGIFPEKALKVISVGFERYFVGDFVSSLHILVPQFEGVFLSLSEERGIDIVALNRGKDISTQRKILSAEYLVSGAFQNVWSKDFCEQLNFVLFEPLGYMIRHKVAHGQIALEECNQDMANLIVYLYLVVAAKAPRRN